MKKLNRLSLLKKAELLPENEMKEILGGFSYYRCYNSDGSYWGMVYGNGSSKQAENFVGGGVNCHQS